MITLPGAETGVAVDICERLRESLEATTISVGDGRTERLTASFGVAAVHRGETIDDILEGADRAVYVAKAAGGNQVQSAPSSHGPGP